MKVEMASLIQKIIQLAQQTFCHHPKLHSAKFQESLGQLKSLVQQITSHDLNLDNNFLQRKETYNPQWNVAPVTYVHVFESTDFTVGIFIMKNGVSLPLHDHPTMHGLLKVLEGNIKIEAYSLLPAEKLESGDSSNHSANSYSPNSTIVRARKYHSSVVTNKDSLCVLTPEEGNIHQLSTFDGPAAFLDILAPPYENSGSRTCHYYGVMPFNCDEKSENELDVWLHRIPTPRDYWCDMAPYTGPILG